MVLDCHYSFFCYPSPDCLCDFLIRSLLNEVTSDVGIISDKSDPRRCNVCFTRVFTLYKSMNIFALFFQDSLVTCLRDFELDIHQLDLFNVLPKPPALIGAMENREAVFVEIAIDANVFHAFRNLIKLQAKPSMAIAAVSAFDLVFPDLRDSHKMMLGCKCSEYPLA